MYALANLHRIKKAPYCNGGTQYLTVSWNGDIYPCCSLAGNQKFYLGNVFQGIDYGRWKNLLEQIDAKNRNGCRACEFRMICPGCYAVSFLANGDVTRPVKAFCQYIKINYEVARKLLRYEFLRPAPESKRNGGEMSV